VTVTCGSALTIVTNIADFCRYTPRRRDMRVGLFASALASVVVTTFVGGYAAAATGASNPWVAVGDLTGSDAVLVVLMAALVVQSTSPNITNVYTAGLSLLNSAPRLGRVGATLLVAAASIALSAFPDFVTEAQKWITHLGNVAAPLTGVIVADFVVRKQGRLDVPALYDPDGRYRYTRGVNVAAVVAVGVGIGVYYAVPAEWLKVLWGIGVGGGVYLVLVRVESLVRVARARTIVGA
jgi:purine-cytosine permease-like protein